MLKTNLLLLRFQGLFETSSKKIIYENEREREREGLRCEYNWKQWPSGWRHLSLYTIHLPLVKISTNTKT
jgi:hypothetical protein